MAKNTPVLKMIQLNCFECGEHRSLWIITKGMAVCNGCLHALFREAATVMPKETVRLLARVLARRKKKAKSKSPSVDGSAK